MLLLQSSTRHYWLFLKTFAFQFSHEGQFLIRWKACEELKGEISFREFKLFRISQNRYILKGKKLLASSSSDLSSDFVFIASSLSLPKVNIGIKAGFFCSCILSSDDRDTLFPNPLVTSEVSLGLVSSRSLRLNPGSLLLSFFEFSLSSDCVNKHYSTSTCQSW